MPTRLPRGRVTARAALLLGAAAVGLVGWGVRSALPGLRHWSDLRQAGRDLAEGRLVDARTRLDQMLREDPAWAAATLLRAEYAARVGHVTEAEELLQRAVDLGLPVVEGLDLHSRLRAGVEPLDPSQP